ncbi:MAG: excalibur calcium-binding domain-containing protein [Sphingomicrobium sp.]
MNVKYILWGAVLVGTAAGYVWSASPQVTPAALSVAAPVAASRATAALPTPEEIEHTRYFASCNEARSAGVAPMFRGQPGYREELDGDGDDIACEPIRRY